MVEPLASYEQLIARLGVEPLGSDVERARAALDDASALVRAEAGLTWVDDHDELEEVPPIVVAVALACAFRAYRNPDGFNYSSVGDVTVSYGRQTNEQGHGGAIFLTDDERRIIRVAIRGTSGSIGTIELVSPYSVGTSNYYVPVLQGGDPLPMGPFPWEVW